MQSGTMQRRRAALVVVTLVALTLNGPLPAGGRLTVAHAAPHSRSGALIPLPARLPRRPAQLSPVVARLHLVGIDAVVDDQTNHVFVSGSGNADKGRVSMLDARSGAVLRTVHVGTYSGFLSLDAPAHRVYVAAQAPNGVRILDTRTERPVGWVPLADGVSGVVADAETDRIFVVTDPSGSNGPVHVYVLERQRPTVLRTIRLGNGISGGIALDAPINRVFVAVLGQDAVTVFDARRGQVVQTVRLPIHPMSLAVDAATQRVFISGDTGVRVLNAGTGAILPTGQTSEHDGGVIAAGARAYITVDYALYIVDGRTGTLLRTVALDPHGQGTVPASLPVLDPQRGRLYVLLTTPTGDIYGDDRTTLAVLAPRTGALQTQVDLHDTGRGAGVVRLAGRAQRLVVLTGSVTTVLDLTRL